MLEFNKSTNIINYYEQSKAVAVVKEDMEVDYKMNTAKLAGIQAGTRRLEEKLQIQENIQDLYLQTAKQILSKIEKNDDLYAELTRTLLTHLDNDKNAFLNRVVQLLKLRDQWMISFFDKAPSFTSCEYH